MIFFIRKEKKHTYLAKETHTWPFFQNRATLKPLSLGDFLIRKEKNTHTWPYFQNRAIFKP